MPLTDDRNEKLQAREQRLPAGFYQFLLDYYFICDNLKTSSPHCQITQVAAYIGDLLSRQMNRGTYADRRDADCQPVFFSNLRVKGITNETLNAIDVEYGKLQDEKARVSNMSRDDFRRYASETFKTLRTITDKKMEAE